MLSFISAILYSFTLASAFPGFGPTHKHLTYSYHARIQVGLKTPTERASYLALRGHLQLQQRDSFTAARLHNVSFSLYNGQIDGYIENESTFLDLPFQVKNLLNPFHIYYDNTGKVTHIKTMSGEEQYTRNMKKALASVLQIDTKCLEADHHHSFDSDENNIYGKVNVHYDITPSGEQLVVQKVQDENSLSIWSSNDLEYRPNTFTNTSYISTTSTYTIVRTQEGHYVRAINTSELIHIEPNNNFMTSQYMTTNQVISLMDNMPADVSHPQPTEQETLLLDLEPVTESGKIPDLTFGRHRPDLDDYISLTYKLLDDIVTYGQQNQLTETVDLYQGAFINKLQGTMRHFNMSTFEHVYNKLKTKAGQHNKQLRSYFLQMIPAVGTKASILFIKTLVGENMVNDEMATSMLQKMSENLIMPSEELLEAAEGLLDLQRSQGVKTAAVLSYATLLHGTFTSKVKTRIDESVLDKYIEKFINNIKSTEDAKIQFIYLSALYNIKTGNVVKHLLPIIQGKLPNVNRHIQYLAMCAAYSHILKNKATLIETVWPILTNRELHLELRIAAYTLITAANPNHKLYADIRDFMSTEPSEEFYHYYYTNIKSLASTINPSLQHIKKNANEILKKIRKPFVRRLSGLYLTEYQTPDKKFNVTLSTQIISTETSKVFYFDFSSELNTPLNTNFDAIWIKLHGHEEVYLEPDVATNAINLGVLLPTLFQISRANNSHIELILLRNDQVIYAQYFKNTDVDVQAYIQSLFGERSVQDIIYKVMKRSILPNIVGFPVTIQFTMPSLSQTKIAISSIKNPETRIRTFKYEIHVLYFRQFVSEINFYNPITDQWQGVEHVKNLDFAVPINVTYFASTVKNNGTNVNSLTFKFSKNENVGESVAGIRSFQSSATYVKGDENNDLLLQSNSKCEEYIPVTYANGDYYTLIDEHDENTGLNYKVGFFDEDLKLDSVSDAKDALDYVLKHSLYIPKMMYIEHNTFQPLTRLVAKMLKLWQGISFPDGYDGVLMASTFSTKNHVDHIDCTSQITVNNGTFLPAYEPYISLGAKDIDWFFKYSIQNKYNGNIRAWGVKMLLKWNSTRTWNNLKMKVTRIGFGEDDGYVCINGVKEWTEEGVHGHLIMSNGTNPDLECTDGIILDIHMKGEHSDEQTDEIKKMRNQYVPPLNCEYVFGVNLPAISSADCLAKLTSYRKYTYAINKINFYHKLNRPLIIREILKDMLHYSKCGNITDGITENTKIHVNFPLEGDAMKARIETGKEVCDVDIRSQPGWSQLGLYPDNYHFYQDYLFFNNLGEADTNIFHRHTFEKVKVDNLGNVTKNGKHIIPNIPISYFIRSNPNNQMTSMDITAKEIETDDTGKTVKKMVLSAVTNNDTIEIAGTSVTVNGSPIDFTTVSYVNGPWYSVGKLPDQRIIIYFHKWDCYIDYDGEYARVIRGPFAD